MKRIVFCLGVVFLMGCGSPQLATLENRLAGLEVENRRHQSSLEEIVQQIEQQKKTIEKLQKITKSERGGYADSVYEIEQIKVRFQQIEGLVDELSFKLVNSKNEQSISNEKQMERLDTVTSRNYEKILRLEKYMGFEPTVGSVSPEAPSKSSVPMKESKLYSLAKKLFDQGDLENARIQFENFINKFPKSDKADNARFWIADSYYAEKWYEKAILEYQKVLERYQTSNKAAAARLKQGYAFIELGEKANARLILKELVKKHPSSKEADYAKQKLKTLN